MADDTIKNELPENYEIDDDIFFLEDDKKEIDLGRGRLNKEDSKPEKKEDEDICSSEQIKKKKVSGPAIESMRRNEDIIKKANFLHNFEERVKRRETAEEKKKIEREIIRRQQQEVRDKKKRGPKFQPCQPNAEKPRDLSVCGITGKDHDYKFDFFNGQVVVTRCTQCSKEKEWHPPEWRKYQRFAKIAVNPNPELFPF